MRKSYDRNKMLDFIRRFVERRGFPPTIGEIQRELNISSKSVVDRHLRILEKEGYIKRNARVTRGIDVSGMGKRSYSVPMFGTIAAGQPILVPTEDTWHSVEEVMVDVPADMLPSNIQAYALRVRGKSMIDALVDNGDIVVLEATPVAEDGQMVAAWLIDEEMATLKKLYQESGRVRLQPANPSMDPIYVDSNKVQVQGRVIAVLRKYHLDSR